MDGPFCHAILDPYSQFHRIERDAFFTDDDQALISHGDPLAIGRMLLHKDKQFAAKFLKEKCLLDPFQTGMKASPVKVLNEMLDMLLEPWADFYSSVADRPENWIRWLIAAGDAPYKFYETVKKFDNPKTCSMVWTADFMAYRCRTCSISQCMSLCLDCFNNGDHVGHDYNRFKSQAGGACDCGNAAVMAKEGFCTRHNKSDSERVSEAPRELFVLARLIVPRFLHAFQLVCRANGMPEGRGGIQKVVLDFQPFVHLLQEICLLGAAMRQIITEAFCSHEIYKEYTDNIHIAGNKFFSEIVRCRDIYLKALDSISFGDPPKGYEDISTLHGPLRHRSFLEEILFWTLKFEFPQKLVCFLLNMRLDPVFEDAFARAFVQHYSRISVILLKTEDSDPLSHRVVHVSVQLFSDQTLACKMTNSYHLLQVMVLSVKRMVQTITIPSTLHDLPENSHQVVNCLHDIMKNHSYWPLVSDLNNILSHKPIALKFMSDSRLLQQWFGFLSMFQGMNNNTRELNQHVEYEPQSYYAAFSAELEVSSSPLWAILSHLNDESTRDYSITVLRHCLLELEKWFNQIGLSRLDKSHRNEATFHLPLHRNFSLLLSQAVKKQGVKLTDVQPSSELLTSLLAHPLRTQVAFYEIVNNLWVRNGLQIKGQAMTYIQCHFCNSMFDPDLYLLQVGAGELPKDTFLLSILDRFNISKFFNLCKSTLVSAESESEGSGFKMIEAFLVFLSILVTNRHNIGLSEQEIAEMELVSLISTYDKTHSKLKEFVPEKCSSNPKIDFDLIVKKFTKYIEPECQKSGEMREGLYVPLDFMWEQHYDPIFTITRCLHKKEYQNSLCRFKKYCRSNSKVNPKTARRLWPPYRLPSPVNPAYRDPRRILACRSFHGLLFILLYKTFHDTSFTENMLGFIIYLLELCIDYQTNTQDTDQSPAQSDSPQSYGTLTTDCIDGLFQSWFTTDCVCSNASTVINRVGLNNSVTPSPIEGEMEGVGMEESSGHFSNEVSDDESSRPPEQQLHQISAPSQSRIVEGPQSPIGQESGQMDQVSVVLPRNAVGSVRGGSLAPSSQETAMPVDLSMPRPSSLETVKTQLDPPPAEALASGQQPFKDAQNSTTLEVEREEFLSVNESIITLLIKLYSKLSDKHHQPYRPDFRPTSEDSRVGDGPFFIAKVLNKLGRASHVAAEHIQSTVRSLFPETEGPAPGASSDEETSLESREEKKKRAKEWQKKIMSSFNRKQQKFLARNMPDAMSKEARGSGSGGSTSPEEIGGADASLVKDYDCVICNQSIPSTLKRPFGLIAFLQPSSVHGSRLTVPHGYDIPRSVLMLTSMSDSYYPRAKHMDEKARALNRSFKLESWLLSMDSGWRNGAYVQTCGHHLHLDCHQSYVLSLQSQPVAQENGANFQKGEYFCPFCRKLANAVLPIFNHISVQSQLSRRGPEGGELQPTLEHQVYEALRESTLPRFNAILETLVVDILGNLTDSVLHELPPFAGWDTSLRPVRPSSPPVFLFVFLSSVLRANLEIELVQSGGSLVTRPADPSGAVRRSSMVPLLHILSYHAKKINLTTSPDSWHAEGPSMAPLVIVKRVWASLCHLEVLEPLEPNDVSLLFRDPVTILLHLVLLLPSSLHLDYYYCLVLNTYRLAVVQSAVTCLRSLPEDQLPTAILNSPLTPLLSMAYNNLADSNLLKKIDPPSPPPIIGIMPKPVVDEPALSDFTSEIRESCLVFLRIAALLKAHIHDQPLPTIVDPLAECGTLERYLNLWDACSVVNTAAMGRMCGTLISDTPLPSSSLTATSPVETKVGDLSGVMRVWCAHGSAWVGADTGIVPKLSKLIDANKRFYHARLLVLPETFDEIFQFYHQRACNECENAPKDPGICLRCGVMVCMRQQCCARHGAFEGVNHAKVCGAGTAVYLAVSQAAIVVIRNARFCLWGSVHLDCYGEEDKDLKRGKPLYLSKGRYQLLEEQWRLGFTNTPHKWTWHNNLV